MGSIQTLTPTFSLITKPQNYPTNPTPGKIEILWAGNTHSLYHRLSPYVQYSNSLIPGFSTSPYVFDYPDEGNKGLSGLRKYESRMFPLGSAPRDVIRVTKFLGSGNGIIFLGKQFLLQTGNPFNETRIYNPISPIVAAGMGLALGAVRPQRNFDTSAGLRGIFSSLFGDTIPNALFGAPKINKPSGTAPDALTGGPLVNTGGKGLIRAGTANAGKAHLDAAWGVSGNKGSFLGNIVKSLFGGFLPQNQSGIKQRSDEGAYGLMLNSAGITSNTAFNYNLTNGRNLDLYQQWFAGGTSGDNVMRKGGTKWVYIGRVIVDGKGGPATTQIGTTAIHDKLYLVGKQVDIGFLRNKDGNDSIHPGARYGDSIGAKISDDFEASEMMINYKFYSDKDQTDARLYPTKKEEYKFIDKQNDELKKVIANLNAVSNRLYQVKVTNPNSKVISSGDTVLNNGYTRLMETVLFDQKRMPLQYPLGVLQDYRKTTVVDETLNHGDGQKSYKLPTAGRFDSINTLAVLPKKAKENNNKEWEGMDLIGWKTPWKPYEDDLIAFFFYDIVNEKYIPFRATIKGLTETGNASWEELPFIGRGDKVYTYGGFTRTLGFNFKIVINSIAELAPTWQRINYLTSLIKPANYTTNTDNKITNRFMVPPMVMLTVGDMYKEQPILIQSVTTTIPDDAAWETLNQENSKEENGNVNNWNYLAGFMKARGVKYGQVPREVEITIAAALLEKERAVVGGINFGDGASADGAEYNFFSAYLVNSNKAYPQQVSSNIADDPSENINVSYEPMGKQKTSYNPDETMKHPPVYNKYPDDPVGGIIPGAG